MFDVPASAPVRTTRDVALPLMAGVWTLFVWGGRVRLLGDDEGTWPNWLRIIASLGFGVALLIVGVANRRGRRTRWAAPLMFAFAAWMVLVWAPSFVSVIAGEASNGFKMVHSALAFGSLALGTAIASLARREVTFYPRATSSQAAASSTAR